MSSDGSCDRFLWYQGGMNEGEIRRFLDRVAAGEGLFAFDGAVTLEGVLSDAFRKCSSRFDVAPVPPWWRGDGRDGDLDREAPLQAMYEAIHGLGHGYTEGEAEVIESVAGHTSLPGGLYAVLLLGRLLEGGGLVVDLGAGNGLQTLLALHLAPRACAVNVELSRSCIGAGIEIQRFMGIARDRVAWMRKDIREFVPHGADVVYTYRPANPARPEGRALYRAVAGNLASLERPVWLVTVTDCLGGALDASLFRRIDSAGPIVVYRGPEASRA